MARDGFGHLVRVMGPASCRFKGDARLYVASCYDPINGSNPAVKDFNERYTKLFPGSKPSSMALMGCSAVAVTVVALKRLQGARPNPGAGRTRRPEGFRREDRAESRRWPRSARRWTRGAPPTS